MTRFAANTLLQVVNGNPFINVWDLDGPVFRPQPVLDLILYFAWSPDPALVALYGPSLPVPGPLLRKPPFDPMSVETVSAIVVPPGFKINVVQGQFTYEHIGVVNGVGVTLESLVWNFDPLAPKTSTPLPTAANPEVGIYVLQMVAAVSFIDAVTGITPLFPATSILPRNNYFNDLGGGDQVPRVNVGAGLDALFIARVALAGDDTNAVALPLGSLGVAATSLGIVRGNAQRIVGL